jgi:hypothetical protein
MLYGLFEVPIWVTFVNFATMIPQMYLTFTRPEITKPAPFLLNLSESDPIRLLDNVLGFINSWVGLLMLFYIIRAVRLAKGELDALIAEPTGNDMVIRLKELMIQRKLPWSRFMSKSPSK